MSKLERIFTISGAALFKVSCLALAPVALAQEPSQLQIPFVLVGVDTAKERKISLQDTVELAQTTATSKSSG